MTNPPGPADPTSQSGQQPPGGVARERPATDSGQGWDEQVWRRPPPSSQAPSPTPPTQQGYTGPPPTMPPDATWRPPVVIQVPPARALPQQDDAAIDGREQQARIVTYGVGLIAGAIGLIVLFILCGRALF